MENIFQAPLPELVFATSDTAVSKQIGKLLNEGLLRKIAPRVYSSNLREASEKIISRNLFQIIGKLFPGAIISHRTALEYKPTATGQIFLTYTYTKKTQLPGVALNFLKGREPLESDHQFMEGLFVSSEERAVLENLEVSRKQGADSKAVPKEQLEEFLDKIIQVRGEEEINLFRDRARKVAKHLGMQKSFKQLQLLIGALLSSQPLKLLTSDVAKARAEGNPYDSGRIKIFEELFRLLKSKRFPRRPDPNKSKKAFENFAFFESYFSNYIEGTVFEVEEAMQIVDTDTPLAGRSEDSHDVLGTFKIVADKKEMSITPRNGEELISLLQSRHRILLRSREGKNPGDFKMKNNRAGQSLFVDFKLTRGTLIRSLDYYRLLEDGFAKAAFMMFVVSEVHPFDDGNGRIARVMMNAELVKAGQSKILIPIVYREDYLLALKKLTRQEDPAPYVRMLERAWEFSAGIFGSNREIMRLDLAECNAFLESGEGKLIY